ncbi:hypothetical protein [Streptomyces sp. NPDC058954]|uniref:hypothetical protein n=1 Tax=Streptomyces sp. NPDC058954 TaxID=3346677 RepID=UPI0036A4D492
MATSTLERQFVWTVIPAGRTVTVPGAAEPMALCSVLLTPRLLGPATGRLTVADFGMQRWPDRLAAVRFDAFRDGQPVPSRQVPPTTHDGHTVSVPRVDRLSAWQTLFAADSLVRPYRPTSYDGREVRAFPASEAAAQVRTVYGATARIHHEYRTAAAHAGPGLREALRRVSDMWQTGLRSPDGDQADDGLAGASPLARGYRFYRRDDADFTPLTRPAEPPETDFHDTVAHLADHPVLLRVLGLLIDLAVPVSALASSDGTPELRVEPRWPSPDPTPPPGWTGAAQHDLTPSTACTLDGQRFVPASVPGPAATVLKEGMLPLAGTDVGSSGTSRYEVVPFDIDGAVLRLVGTTQSDRDHQAGPSGGPGQSPPSPGAAPPPGALPALRSAGFALVERDREQEHGRQLDRARQRSTPGGLTGTALTADSLLGGYRMDVQDLTTGRWYSLSRRRVRYSVGGVPIGDGPDGVLEEGWVRPGPLTTGAGPDDALYVHQAVAGWDGWSPVTQRPERIVDTGDPQPVVSSPPPFDAEVVCEPGSLARLRFGRCYRLRVRIADLAGGGLRADEVRPGEEQTQVVTHHRYEPMLPPEILPTRAFADGEGQDRMVVRSDRGMPAAQYAAAHGLRAYDLRHLLAPKCSLELAMQYDGRFDAAVGPAAADADVNRLFDVARRADRGIHDIPGAVDVHSGSDANASYVVLPETGVTLPWLADPGASYVALNARPRPVDPRTGYPGEISPPATVTAVWSGDWPGLKPIQLRLVDAPSGCTVTRSPDKLVLTVALGPAEQVTFDVPSCPRTREVQIFGVTAWMSGVDPTNPATFPDIVQGRNPMITPSRTVTLVHAVQHPLLEPAGALTPRRQPGDTDALLTTEALRLDIPSTGRIDVRADWTDTQDLPTDPPAPVAHSAHVGSYDVQHLPLDDALPPIRQEFGDTRHHRVGYTVTGVSRFQDCFAAAVAADPAACQATGVLADVHVPASVRPPAPKTLYTVPTFRWTQTTDGSGTITRLRQGGGLRVFLERPWYVSGDDEALAVLTWATTSAPDDVLPVVSVAGRDPLRDTGAPPAVLTPGQFNAPAAVRADLPEANRTLEVLPHQAEFDRERGRWFADLDLAPVVAGSYFPFVRLALARYQPWTATGVPRLSPAIQTESIQLPPHRRLIVTRARGKATVTVDGLAPAGPAPNLIRTELQIMNTPPGPGGHAVADGAGWTTLFRGTTGLGQNQVVDIPAAGPRPLRLAVQEFETYPPPRAGAPDDSPGRLVYADVVPLAPV